LARNGGFKVVGFYFESKQADAFRRNEERPEEQRVPRVGILGTHKRLQIPSLSEGFDELDEKMRVFETTHVFCVLPEMYMVARIDGRGFTSLTKEVHSFEAPFDLRFRDMMVATTEHLMNCGYRVLYGYTPSDEISLLFHPNENSFGRQTRKLNSILAGEASAKFSLQLGGCRRFRMPHQ
jgi:hypothetical protein